MPRVCLVIAVELNESNINKGKGKGKVGRMLDDKTPFFFFFQQCSCRHIFCCFFINWGEEESGGYFLRIRVNLDPIKLGCIAHSYQLPQGESSLKIHLRACAAASAAFVVVVRAGRGRWGVGGWKREKRDQASKV